MDFSIPADIEKDVLHFKIFIKNFISPNLTTWYQQNQIPRQFFEAMGAGGWYGLTLKNKRLIRKPALREALIIEELAKVSPGLSVAALAQLDLGLMGLFLFGSEDLQKKYGASAISGKAVMCLGNSESKAGSDVAGISLQAQKVTGGWLLNGAKAYVTNGLAGDLAVITAVSHPDAPRNSRISMFLVDLHVQGVERKKLNKQVWIPADLTRLQFKDVFVSEDHLLGKQGRGLQQVLTVFTYSRVSIAALTIGTAVGAFNLAVAHAAKREVFGKKIIEFQAKAFEIADYHARIEAARLMLMKACWKMDQSRDFRQESSLAKYLAVDVAKAVSTWAADLFGAASVVFGHPIHKFPMDAWAASLGEGTQDVQKLVIFRELMNRFGEVGHK
jgi:alkylation response protein AidB-like acyl-CoA dehydrogenase